MNRALWISLLFSAVALTMLAARAPAQDAPAPATAPSQLKFIGRDLIGTVSWLNFSPDFTLTADQKTAIAAIRGAFEKNRQTWQQVHQPELDALRAQLGQATAANDKEKLAGILKDFRELQQKCPQPAEMNDKIMAILTEDQRNAVNDFARPPVPPDPQVP